LQTTLAPHVEFLIAFMPVFVARSEACIQYE